MSQIAGLIFGLAGLLALIAVLPPAAARLRLPYTVLLALLGCALGLAIGIAEGIRTSPLPEGMEPIERPFLDFLVQLGSIPITADVFLWVFLPLLLFETASGIDTGELLDDLGPVLVLAIGAVVLCALVAGVAVWAVTGFTFVACLLVASIIATTDPAAVVAIFREVGAPKRLVALVEGESLLNDAAAIALASGLLAVVVSNAPPDPEAMAVLFAWEFIGGALLGGLMGRLAGILVSRLDQGGPAEVTLSLALAYLTYALADIYLHVSGVVAVVLAGLVFGGIGRARVGHREWQSLRAIWSQLGFWASSLIFVLASMLVPDTLASATWQDGLALLALIGGALVARALTLFLITPVTARLSRTRPIDHRYKLVIIWGGLRGAVTLALALAVTERRGVSAEVQHLVSVLATGFVLFTLLVQGTTLQMLIRWLGLNRLSPVERLIRLRALELARAEIKDELSSAAITHGLDLEAAKALAPVLREPEQIEELQVEPGEEMLREQVVTALATVTTRELELHVEGVAERTISMAGGARGIKDATALLDALRAEGFPGYRRVVRQLGELDRWTRIAAWLHRALRLERPLAARLAARVELFLAKRMVVEELVTFTRRRIKALFGQRPAETIERILESRLEGIDRTLDALRLQYPAHWQAASNQYLGRMALRLEHDRYRQMHEERLLSPQLRDDLVADVRRRMATLERTPPLDLGLDAIALMRAVPLFESLPDERLAEVRRLLRPRLALPNERIVRKGEQGDAMYFIASGAVEVVREGEPIRLGTGEFFGEMSLIQRRPRSADVMALGYSQLLELRRDSFRALLRLDPALMQQVRQVAEARLRAAAGAMPGSTGEPDLDDGESEPETAAA